MNSKGYGTNLAASYGANQTRPTSAAFIDNASSCRNTFNGTATPPGALAELKLKAKESILAKKAQNIRSSSQDTAIQMNGTDLNNAIKGEARTQNDKPKTRVETTQHDSSFSEEGSIEPPQSKLNLSMHQNSQNSLTEVPRVYSPYAKVNNNLMLPKDDHSGGVKASSVELEDLLAEGRAAAERRSQIAPESTGFRSGPERRSQPILADNPKPPGQTDTGATAKRSASQHIPSNDSPQQHEISGKEYNGTDPRTERYQEGPMTRQVQANSTPEKILGDISTNSRKLKADRDTDMSDAPESENLGHQTYPSQLNQPLRSQDQMITHDTSVAGVQYNADDVEEWLAMTGFYDEVYRHKVLNRRRRMKAIEEERLQLLLEEQADQDRRSQLVRSQPVLATNAAPVSPFLGRASSVLPMPAPPPGSSAPKDLGLRIKDSALKNENPPVTAKPTENIVKAGSLKRRNSPCDMKEEEGQARKMVRTELDDYETAPSRRLSDKASAGSSLIHQKSPQVRTEKFVEEQQPSDPRRAGGPNGLHSAKRRYDQWVPDKPAVYDDRRRDSHDDRDIRSFDLDRRTNRPTVNSGQRYSDYQKSDHRPDRYTEQDRFRRDSRADTSPTKSGINLKVNNVRYFLIKSWNYENIETAQRECTWCTQTKNEDLFVDAFRNSIHVILIFSANNSHAFQGYARMQCLPGEPGVTDPTWRKYLHWPTTKPFKIRWITKGNSSYRVAGDLRNPLNDDSMVFVGRDGQEIPDYIGLELCEALDQDAKYRPNKLDY
jgi:YTH domain-containing protein 1